MTERSWKFRVAAALVGCSAVLAVSHVLAFHDGSTLAFYLALDVVFVPIQVLLVSLLIERLLAEREKQAMLKKLNMVIGAFFGELGNRLLRDLVRFSEDAPALAGHLAVDPTWGEAEYARAARFAAACAWRIDVEPSAFSELKALLLGGRGFVLALLQNANLLEHERFTDLLWALSHLTEELEARQAFAALPPTDLAHLNGDVRRVFGLLARQWLAYMEHLKSDYPYIYSLSTRMNPFLPQASPIVA